LIENNTAGSHGGAIGANSENANTIKLQIGKSTCDGSTHIDHEDGQCPQIIQNSASVFGGAFCLHGDSLIVDIYCGRIQGNIATRNPGSNSLNQSGGVITVYAGQIDPGLMIGGGEFIDNRINSKQIVIRFWGNYDGAPSNPKVVNVTNGITVSFPVDIYNRSDHFLTGWATSPDASGIYVPANGQYTINTNADVLDFYAVWDVSSTYIVHIPDTLIIGDTNAGEMKIGADLFYFLELSTIDISIHSDFLLHHEYDSNLVLPMSVYTSEYGVNGPLRSGDVAATFQYNNNDMKTISVDIDVTDAQLCTGKYVGQLTFVVDYYVKDGH
jgi:hypothetical protein